jgi:hypothetical protein
MPERAEWFNSVVSKYTKSKLPAFFEYAKDKELCQVEERNESFVNKIFYKIPNKSINTRSLDLGKIEYKKMMSNVNIICTKDVSELYDELNTQYRYMINMKDEHIDNMRHVSCKIRDNFSSFGYSDETIADMLVEYLYGRNKRYKHLLWFCYGHIIVNNLENNISVKKTKYVQCVDCGEWFETIYMSKSARCVTCNKIYKKEMTRNRVERYRKSKM